ncbi:hypothetical protein FQN57_004407 [Myotisia sp. PD_48]|nr:hypothetical protein FQN57_004407 [Myotisia sp. PD_48]
MASNAPSPSEPPSPGLASNHESQSLLHYHAAASPQDVSSATTSQPGKKRKANTSRGVANLTPEQLAKKRANDREAQRAIRRRTRSQIEALEQRVRELTSQQPYQDLQEALRQKHLVQAENDEIKRRLTAIIATIQPILTPNIITNHINTLDRSVCPGSIADNHNHTCANANANATPNSTHPDARSWAGPNNANNPNGESPSPRSHPDDISQHHPPLHPGPPDHSIRKPAAFEPVNGSTAPYPASSVTSFEPPSPSHSGPTQGSRKNWLTTATNTNHSSSSSINNTNNIISNGNNTHHSPLDQGHPPSSQIFDFQRRNLTHSLDFSGKGEKLGLSFLLDSSQHIPKINDYRPAPIAPAPAIPGVQGRYPGQHGRASNVSGSGSSSFADTQMSRHYSMPVRNIEPTCPMDGILLDFLRTRQREAAEGVPSRQLIGPRYPSVSSLLNPAQGPYSHPLSRVFTDILSKFPDISTLPEQVAVLYVMFLFMRWQIYPTRENYDRLPDWFAPRPSQLITPHPAWIDYLPWPLMRDRMISSYTDYDFSNWFIPYCSGLSVNWPYEQTDILLSTSESEELIVNPVFERHLRDLNNWSLGPAFAKAYPHLVDGTRINPDPKEQNMT